MKQLKVKKLTDSAKLPTKAYQFDAGFDLYADGSNHIFSGGRTLISTGIALEIPEGYVGLIWPRSGLAVKHGIDVLAGVIDSSYRGEIKVCLANTEPLDTDHHLNDFCINHGDKIAQILIQEIPQFEILQTDELSETDRGNKGFGSSG